MPDLQRTKIRGASPNTEKATLKKMSTDVLPTSSDFNRIDKFVTNTVLQYLTSAKRHIQPVLDEIVKNVTPQDLISHDNLDTVCSISNVQLKALEKGINLFHQVKSIMTSDGKNSNSYHKLNNTNSSLITVNNQQNRDKDVTFISKELYEALLVFYKDLESTIANVQNFQKETVEKRTNMRPSSAKSLDLPLSTNKTRLKDKRILSKIDLKSRSDKAASTTTKMNIRECDNFQNEFENLKCVLKTLKTFINNYTKSACNVAYHTNNNKMTNSNNKVQMRSSSNKTLNMSKAKIQVKSLLEQLREVQVVLENFHRKTEMDPLKMTTIPEKIKHPHKIPIPIRKKINDTQFGFGTSNNQLLSNVSVSSLPQKFFRSKRNVTTLNYNSDYSMNINSAAKRERNSNKLNEKRCQTCIPKPRQSVKAVQANMLFYKDRRNKLAFSQLPQKIKNEYKSKSHKILQTSDVRSVKSEVVRCKQTHKSKETVIGNTLDLRHAYKMPKNRPDIRVRAKSSQSYKNEEKINRENRNRQFRNNFETLKTSHSENAEITKDKFRSTMTKSVNNDLKDICYLDNWNSRRNNRKNIKEKKASSLSILKEKHGRFATAERNTDNNIITKKKNQPNNFKKGTSGKNYCTQTFLIQTLPTQPAQIQNNNKIEYSIDELIKNPYRKRRRIY
ncbi:uncharacterized protein LOC112905342 [Agrilus planipennis]|uniref:Uncharacterized protein LOC112905342 n=1 Tax=Agrilus planipennis TaxID=224129 RepID=A0A7F5RBG1_AGRPL|nr:uncharacterized protein LOC112905342 [Agrilus planipennis]